MDHELLGDKLEKGDPETLAFIARGARLQRMRKILATASHRYNVVKGPRQAIESSRSNSWRTVS